MIRLTIKERQALKYATTKAQGDREVRAARRLMHAKSSTPTLQHWLEHRGGWFLMLLVAGAIFGLAACGQFEARPDLKQSTITGPQDRVTCSKGHKARITGLDYNGAPIVEVTNKPCEVSP